MITLSNNELLISTVMHRSLCVLKLNRLFILNVAADKCKRLLCDKILNVVRCFLQNVGVKNCFMQIRFVALKIYNVSLCIFCLEQIYRFFQLLLHSCLFNYIVLDSMLKRIHFVQIVHYTLQYFFRLF